MRPRFLPAALAAAAFSSLLSCSPDSISSPALRPPGRVTASVEPPSVSEQVVFAGFAPASSSTFPSSSPASFWVWCELESGNPYEGVCNGAVVFPALRLAKHVAGGISTVGTGLYKMTVSSTLDNSIVHCVLTNAASPVRGPNNTVNVSCSTPEGAATSSTAVIGGTGSVS